MRAAIDALLSLPASRRVAIVGVMAEISDSVAEHRAIARYAADGNGELIAVDTDLYGVAPVGDVTALLRSIAGGDAVLVKGSRVAGLEKLAALLITG